MKKIKVKCLILKCPKGKTGTEKEQSFYIKVDKKFRLKGKKISEAHYSVFIIFPKKDLRMGQISYPYTAFQYQ